MIAIRYLPPDRARRRQRDHIIGRKVSLIQDLQELMPDISGGADDGDFVSHNICSFIV